MENINILKSFSKKEIEIFKNYITLEKYNENQVIIKENSNDRAMYFIIEGNFIIKKGDLEIGKIKTGNHFGELSLISGRPRLASLN